MLPGVKAGAFHSLFVYVVKVIAQIGSPNYTMIRNEFNRIFYLILFDSLRSLITIRRNDVRELCKRVKSDSLRLI